MQVSGQLLAEKVKKAGTQLYFLLYNPGYNMREAP